MIKTYKFRLYPTRKQIEKLDWMLDICRILYNSCLADRNRHYKETGKGLSRMDQQKILVQDKKNITYLTGIHSQVLQDVLFRVEKAYKAFFRRLKSKDGKAGYPRFKNYGRYDSITYTQSGFSIIDGKLKLSKLGTIKLKQHRNINGIIKTCNIKKEIDKWYVCLSVEYNKVIQKQTNINKHIGIDAGIKSFVCFSNDNIINNPKYLIKSEEELIKKQRRLSNKKKGSNNRKKAKVSVSKFHKRISNQRKDFQHKLSRKLVDNYDAIGAEDLSIKNMVKNHNLAKSINDAGWGQFISYIAYKAEEAGKLFMKVNPKGTSKDCHICGYNCPDMTLSIRQWTCPVCHTVHNRDINAACNVDRRMLEKIRQELPEYTLGETGSMDDIISSNAYALKSIPSLNQESSSVRAR
ncbi:MAG: transposase [Deltaproteobacteria bacterium]|jgi:putative transposase|nr:transposase [Deltaproteobacteria bacterium]MCL5880447.1 transposase [Deltaproteobacteria bacterium]MDA8304628.1 transposase [Deltaproteobacteria bacterium]